MRTDCSSTCNHYPLSKESSFCPLNLCLAANRFKRHCQLPKPSKRTTKQVVVELNKQTAEGEIRPAIAMRSFILLCITLAQPKSRFDCNETMHRLRLKRRSRGSTKNHSSANSIRWKSIICKQSTILSKYISGQFNVSAISFSQWRRRPSYLKIPPSVALTRA